jgi:hypothetical protein
MKTLPTALAIACLTVTAASAQKNFGDDLIARFAGDWTLAGTIAGREVVHDVEAAWVLDGYYLQIHEVSRERSPAGSPEYEALVTIGWEPTTSEYVCQWLDSTGGTGLRDGVLGHGQREGDSIPFVFGGGGETAIHNTFHYDRETDTWSWAIDNVEDGEHHPFARVVLKRK